MLRVQPDDGLVYTVHNRLEELLRGKNVVQRTGTIFRQPLGHAVKTVCHFAELLMPAHIETLFVIMVSYLEDAARQFLDRLTDGTGKPCQQYETGKDTNSSRDGNPHQRTLQSGCGGRAVWVCSSQNLEVYDRKGYQQNNHAGENAHTEYQFCTNIHNAPKN